MKKPEEIKYVKQFIKYVERGYGIRVCKDTAPSCFNCQAQYILGFLREHLTVIEWEVEEDNKEKKK